MKNINEKEHKFQDKIVKSVMLYGFILLILFVVFKPYFDVTKKSLTGFTIGFSVFYWIIASLYIFREKVSRIKLISDTLLGLVILLFIVLPIAVSITKNGAIHWAVIFAFGFFWYKLKIKEALAAAGKLKSKGSSGVILGNMGGTVIKKPPYESGHVLVVGGSGTGKSTCVSIPTLFEWRGGALVIDVKRELSKITARQREEHGKVYIFDPEEGGAGYDPLEQVKGIDGAMELARNIVPVPVKGEPFWAQNAQGVFASCILDGIEKGDRFVEICRRILVTEPEKLLKELTESPKDEIKLLAASCNGMPEKTLGGVFSELRSHLLLFASDEKIKKATAYSGFTPAVLEEGATVYLRVSEHLIEQCRGLWGVIISQVLRFLNQRGEGKEPPVLILLDEFPRMGKINGIREALATLRSRNVHIVPMIQSLSDIDLHYGQDERKIICDNCSYKLILSATDADTQEYFSKLAGTEKKLQVSKTKGIKLLSRSTTHSFQEEKNIKPEEFGLLNSKGEAVLFSMKTTPVKLKKSPWYKNKKYSKDFI